MILIIFGLMILSVVIGLKFYLKKNFHLKSKKKIQKTGIYGTRMVKISSDTLYTNDNVALKVETRHYTREITFLNLHPSDFSLINSFEIPVQYNGRSSRLHIFINSHLYVPGESVIFYADSYTLKIDRNGYELFSVGTRRDQFNVKGNNGLTAITTTSFEEEIKLTTCEGKN